MRQRDERVHLGLPHLVFRGDRLWPLSSPQGLVTPPDSPFVLPYPELWDEACRRALDPPRFCPACGRRLRVRIFVHGLKTMTVSAFPVDRFQSERVFIEVAGLRQVLHRDIGRRIPVSKHGRLL